jgi:phosphoenolpyruvate carboxykinase (ATP)
MNNIESSRHDDLPFAELIEHAVALKEGVLTANGAFAVNTEHNSLVKRFVVNEPSVTDVIRAGAELSLLGEVAFDAMWDRIKDDMVEKNRYRLSAHMGVNPDIAVPLQINTLKAWHAMSCHHLCHIPKHFNPREKPLWKIFWVPSKMLGDISAISDNSGVVLMHVGKRRVVISGDLSTGEIRRTLLTVLSLLLPEKKMLPLHGAAAQGDKEITLFLGPAGTQKTTWALRCGRLIGDRGLSWSESGLHRLSDGCRLHFDQNLPISLHDKLTFGTIAENLSLDAGRNPIEREASEKDPVSTHLLIPMNRLHTTQESETRGPSQLVILATDPLGVLPPLAKISPEQALAWFILGYGNHLGPLEEREASINIRFTPGFMDSLLPRNLDDYIYILEDLLEIHDSRCFLVNAGWHGGRAGQGKPLSASKENAVITAMYYCTNWESYGALGLTVPARHAEGGDPSHAEADWSSREDYKICMIELIQSIRNELSRRNDSERWLKALDI